jgi:hypothetical protein
MPSQGRLSIAPDKTKLCPPFKHLGHTIVDNIVKLPKLKLHIKRGYDIKLITDTIRKY